MQKLKHLWTTLLSRTPVLKVSISKNMTIDLCNHASLLRSRAELEALLATVNFAISKITVNGSSGTTNGTVNPQYQPVLDLLTTLPDQFTTSSVFTAMGSVATESRGTVRGALKQFEELKLIALIDKGRGRKPSTYQKLSPTGPIHQAESGNATR